jgi:WD40 repeat protein
MIPDHRLAVLLDHVKQDQINQCLYHNTSSPPSLYCDHICDRKDFPLHPTIELKQHEDEVWYVEFSHDGSKLVTTCKDNKVVIWETNTFTVVKQLSEHEKSVTNATWSPDDTKLITCSLDTRARVWSVEVSRAFATGFFQFDLRLFYSLLG